MTSTLISKELGQKIPKIGLVDTRRPIGGTDMMPKKNLTRERLFTFVLKYELLLKKLSIMDHGQLYTYHDDGFPGSYSW